MNKALFALLISSQALLFGCSVLPTNWGKEEGLAWCNERYLDLVDEYQNQPKPGSSLEKKLRLSSQGYIYSMAAVLTLQDETKDSTYNFKQPKSLQHLKQYDVKKASGFEASTFLHTDKSGTPIEVIISYAGSNQIRDYLLHNISPIPNQYGSARDYVKMIHNAPEAKGLKIITTGYSLGGGLAAHVKKHEETAHLVDQAWTFNPSPRIGWGVSSKQDDDIYLLATSQEVLGIFKRTKIGAKKEHRSESFNLIDSSSIYSHYRWVLARQVLQYADLKEYIDSGRTSQSTEPLDIIKTSSKNCTNEELKKIQTWRNEYVKRKAAEI